MPKQLDLTGRTIGRLFVEGPAPRDKRGPAWHVRCACGTETVCPSRSLLSGCGRRSCGCAGRIDLVGATFGMLEVKALAPRIARQQGMRWTCQCKCGRTTAARAKDLKTGNTTSCGCLVNRPVVSRGELTPRQLAALAAIAHAPDGLRCAELMPLLGISQTNVGKNVRRLVERGLVVRQRPYVNGSRITVLPAGLDVLYGPGGTAKASRPPRQRSPAPAEHHAT
ncbi:MAG TPA: MarR family transcriptional regulator [Acetobacteraceae bacterium]